MRCYRFLLAAVLALGVTPALAQNGGFVNATGVVQSISPGSVTITSDDGGKVEAFKLSPTWIAVQSKQATLADIRPDDFVASAAMRGTDGKLHSTELRIFPPAMRGQGEGQRPMNDAQHQTMTNATVTGTAIVDGANDLKVKFQGGESELMVGPGIPISRIDVVDKSLVKPGAKVRLQGNASSDGPIVQRIALQ